jgi:hypothetical protein
MQKTWSHDNPLDILKGLYYLRSTVNFKNKIGSASHFQELML